MKPQKLSKAAHAFAIKAHAAANHYYGKGKAVPYSAHLEMALAIATMFIKLVPRPKRELVRAAISCHDLMEDARVSWGELVDLFGKDLAELVYALTNEKGRTAADKENYKYYAGIREIPYADFVKICDRTANVLYSALTNSAMLRSYRSRQRDFREQLYSDKYEPMFDYLESILKATDADLQKMDIPEVLKTYAARSNNPY